MATIMDFIENNYHDLLKLAINMTGNQQDGEDVLHTVAMKICQKQEELEHIAYCRAYLMTCIKNASLNLKRSKARQRRSDADFDTIQDTVSDPAQKDAFAYVEWVESLEKHLSPYDEAYRKAFIAYYIDQESLESLAASLGLTKRQTTKKFENMRLYLKRNYKHLFIQLSVLLSM